MGVKLFENAGLCLFARVVFGRLYGGTSVEMERGRSLTGFAGDAA
jgi:hypothetical protein